MTINEIMMSLEIGLIYGIIAVGIYLTFRVIDFPDLTCDGSFVLGTAFSGILIQAGCDPFFALLIAMLSGGLAGFMTGALTIWFKASDLLAGILVAFMLYSVNLRIMGGVPNIALIGIKTIFTTPAPLVPLVFICLLICGALSYLFVTDFGLALRSMGQNKRLAQNSGVNVKIMVLTGLILSNALIALGGALFSQQQGFSDVGSGVGTLIVGLASVMIGERLFPCRSLWVQLLSCFLGSIVYRIFISIALHNEVLGLETQDLNLLTGIMVIAVVALSRKGRSC